MKKRLYLETTSFSLHLMAMAFMLCDHLWGTVVPGNDWLTCIGRLTFPIYAFMLVEGYFHTKNLKKYVLRLLVFALISEIPFNLAMGGSVFYPLHQNVLFAFLLAIGLIHWNERVKGKRMWLRVLVAAATLLIGYVGGIASFVDYNGAGILMVLTFYFFREKKWWCYAAQLLCLWYINMELLGGFGWDVNILGGTHFISRQGIALLALVPIWLYRGKQGHHSKAWQMICYSFYPAHLLVLGLIRILI